MGTWHQFKTRRPGPTSPTLWSLWFALPFHLNSRFKIRMGLRISFKFIMECFRWKTSPNRTQSACTTPLCYWRIAYSSLTRACSERFAFFVKVAFYMVNFVFYLNCLFIYSSLFIIKSKDKGWSVVDENLLGCAVHSTSTGNVRDNLNLAYTMTRWGQLVDKSVFSFPPVWYTCAICRPWTTLTCPSAD